MATTKIVLLSDSTGGWFFDPSQVQEFMPRELYERYGRTVRTANNPNLGGSYSSLSTRWHGVSGADVIELWDAHVGGTNWDDIDAAELQTRVTDVSPNYVLVAYGINGGLTNAQNGTLQAGLEGLYDEIVAAVPSTSVIFVSQNPLSADDGDPAYRDAVQAAATTKGTLFIDCYQAFIDYGDWDPDLVGDGVHPNDDGKQLYADTVEPAVFSAGLLGSAQEESTVAVIDSAELVLRANRYSGSGDWLDESGNGHHATPFGSPTWDGEKFTLDGLTQYFTIPDHDNLDPGAGDITVVVVASWASGGANGFLIEKRAGGIPWWNLASDTVNDRLGMGINDGTDPAVLTRSPDGSWPADTVATVSWRVTRSSDEQRAGADDAFRSGDISSIGSVTSATDVTIGRWSAHDQSYFTGDVYGVAIFTTSLSDADVEKVGEELVIPPLLQLLGVGS